MLTIMVVAGYRSGGIGGGIIGTLEKSGRHEAYNTTNVLFVARVYHTPDCGGGSGDGSGGGVVVFGDSDGDGSNGGGGAELMAVVMVVVVIVI